VAVTGCARPSTEKLAELRHFPWDWNDSKAGLLALVATEMMREQFIS